MQQKDILGRHFENSHISLHSCPLAPAMYVPVRKDRWPLRAFVLSGALLGNIRKLVLRVMGIWHKSSGHLTRLYGWAGWSKSGASLTCIKFKCFYCLRKDLNRIEWNSQNLQPLYMFYQTAIINRWMGMSGFGVAIVILLGCWDGEESCSTYRIPFYKVWVRHNSNEVGNCKHGVQHIRKKQILMQCYPLTAEAPEKYVAHIVN